MTDESDKLYLNEEDMTRCNNELNNKGYLRYGEILKLVGILDDDDVEGGL